MTAHTAFQLREVVLLRFFGCFSLFLAAFSVSLVILIRLLNVLFSTSVRFIPVTFRLTLYSRAILDPPSASQGRFGGCSTQPAAPCIDHRGSAPLQSFPLTTRLRGSADCGWLTPTLTALTPISYPKFSLRLLPLNSPRKTVWARKPAAFWQLWEHHKYFRMTGNSFLDGAWFAFLI